jgi:hypothetical protein
MENGDSTIEKPVSEEKTWLNLTVENEETFVNRIKVKDSGVTKIMVS